MKPAKPLRITQLSGKPADNPKVPLTLFNVSPARREAFAILVELEKPAAHSDDLLRSASVSALSAQDRHLTTTLVMGTLRWQIALDAAIRPLLSKPNARLDPEIQIALRLGAFQLLHLDRIPAHAAIGESVALAKRAGQKFASGMVNAVLRKLAAQPKPDPSSPATAQQLAAATAHPEWLVTRWIANYGFEAAQDICRHGQQQPELSLRIENPEIETDLAGQGIELAPGTILTAARRVLSGDLAITKAFQSGKIQIQEEGSQLIAELAGHGRKILDCCAAPGGKTLILAERNPHAKITALEISPARLGALKTRIAVTHFASQITAQQADATNLTNSETYDLVLADVPCSGTGTLGRNPEIRHRFTEAYLAHHHDRQCAILRGALKAGSRRVLYSTCSLEPEENQQVVDEVLKSNPDWCQSSLSTDLALLTADGRLTCSGSRFLLASLSNQGSLILVPASSDMPSNSDAFYAALLVKN